MPLARPSAPGRFPLAAAPWEKRAPVLAAEIAEAARLDARIDVAALEPRAAGLVALEQAVATCRQYRLRRVLALVDQLRAVERSARRQGEAPLAGLAADLARDWQALDWEEAYRASRAALAADLDPQSLMVQDAAARLVRGGLCYEEGPQRAEDWQGLVRPEGHRLSQIVSALPDHRRAFWHRFRQFQSFDLAALKLEGADEAGRTKRLAVLREALRQAEAIAEHRAE